MKSRQNQRGQMFVESGLVMLVFLPVLIGVMDFSQFLYLHLSLTERTRPAAHYGAITAYSDGSDIVNVAIYNDPTGAANGAKPLLPNLQSTDSGKDGYVTATLTGAGTDDARIRVISRIIHTAFSSCRPMSITGRSRIPNHTKSAGRRRCTIPSPWTGGFCM